MESVGEPWNKENKQGFGRDRERDMNGEVRNINTLEVRKEFLKRKLMI